MIKIFNQNKMGIFKSSLVFKEPEDKVLILSKHLFRILPESIHFNKANDRVYTTLTKEELDKLINSLGIF